jgi:hypothetical protein
MAMDQFYVCPCAPGAAAPIRRLQSPGSVNYRTWRNSGIPHFHSSSRVVPWRAASMEGSSQDSGGPASAALDCTALH